MRCYPKSTLGLYASQPDEHLRLPRSLDKNGLTGPYGNDMSGVIKLAEMLPQSKLQSLR